MPTDGTNRLICTVDKTDPGDETFRRFRYQATYAATLAVELLDVTDVVEVYCEHHEDILLRLASGRFRGIQVKTRDDSGTPFKATDEKILDSLLAFLELDLEFPGHFEGFVLATNNSFDKAGRGHGNLRAVIAEAQEFANVPTAPCAKAVRLAKTLIQRHAKKSKTAKTAASLHSEVANGNAKTAAAATKRDKQYTPKARDVVASATSQTPTIAQTLGVLAKVSAQDDLPKLADIKPRMRERLVRLSKTAAASTIPAVDRAVDALEYAAYLASSRGDEDRNGRHWFVTDSIARARLNVTDEVKAKCLTRAIVDGAIRTYCTGPLLVSADPVSPDQIPKDLGLMEKKLVAGGLSAATVNVALDAVASLEEFGARMLYLLDEESGIRRYNHVRSIVRKECTFAYETQAASGNVNGPRMLADIETRLKSRRSEDTSGLLVECEEEHLLGHVFSLTGQCFVWWSTSRKLEMPENRETGEVTDE